MCVIVCVFAKALNGVKTHRRKLTQRKVFGKQPRQEGVFPGGLASAS